MTFLQPTQLQEGHKGPASFSYGGLTLKLGFKELGQTWTQQNVHSDHPTKSSTMAWLPLQNLPHELHKIQQLLYFWGKCNSAADSVEGVLF